MVAVLSGTRNSANYHSQPLGRAECGRLGPGRPLAWPCLWGITSAADRAVANAFSTRLTSDATRESLKCMATQLVNNERKKNCRRGWLQDNVIELSSSIYSVLGDRTHEQRTISLIVLGIATASGFDRITDDWWSTQCAKCMREDRDTSMRLRRRYCDLTACRRWDAASVCRIVGQCAAFLLLMNYSGGVLCFRVFYSFILLPATWHVYDSHLVLSRLKTRSSATAEKQRVSCGESQMLYS